MTLLARIGQTPPDHRGGYELDVDELHVKATTYDEALAAASDQTPAGWRLLSVQLDRTS